MRAGDKVDRYKLVRRLGRGSFGLAFLAHDELIGADVCLKVLHGHLTENPAAVERFRRELLISRRITHPNVCRAFDFGLSDEGTAFITMEFVEGRDLTKVLTQDAPLDIGPCARLFSSLCAGVAAAHALDVVHRDLKPSNIILRDDGEPIVCDFGLARAADFDSITKTGMAMGTTAYMAPEVWSEGVVAPTVDVWALGVILYRALTGERPYDLKLRPDELLKRMMAGPPPPPSQHVASLTPAVDEVVLKALAVEPDKRYPDAGALEGAVATLPVRSLPDRTRAKSAPSTSATAETEGSVTRQQPAQPASAGSRTMVVPGIDEAPTALFSASLHTVPSSESSLDTELAASGSHFSGGSSSGWDEGDTKVLALDAQPDVTQEPEESASAGASGEPGSAAAPESTAPEGIRPFELGASTAVRPLHRARRHVVFAGLASLALVGLLVAGLLSSDEEAVTSAVVATARSSTPSTNQKPTSKTRPTPSAPSAPHEPQTGADTREPGGSAQENAREDAERTNQTDQASKHLRDERPKSAERSRSSAERSRSSSRTSHSARTLVARRKQLESSMRAKSILSSDDRKLATSLAAAKKAERAGRTAQMARHLRAAEDRLASIRVDRAFVERKLNRFNARFDKVSGSELARLDQRARKIAAALTARDYAKANRLLTAGLRASR